ncbi:MAG: VanZ family protein, partial [Chlorobi bacterium]|nr:VanZ family protein [Chlorobiota bacterium]
NFRNMSSKQILLTVLIFGVLFGLSDEYHQSFIPGRMAGIDDWIADTVGIIISLFLINPLKRASGTNN